MSDLDQAKGRVKQAVGDLTDDDELRREGKIDQRAGKAKEKVGELEEKAERAINTAKEKLR